MAKKKRTFESFQTSKSNGNFMMLYLDMVDSEAWQQLTAYDIQLYLHMLRKYQRKTTKGQIWDSNSDNISIPAKEYRQIMHQATFEKCIDHLIEVGFLKLIENRYKTRQCNIYGFTDTWQKYGTKEFNVEPEHKRKNYI